MIIPLLAVVLVLSPAVTGGRLRRYADVRIRQGWVVAVALAIQVLAIEVLPGAAQPVLSAVHIATYLAAGWFVWLNRTIPGLWLVALGAASNGVTIALNGGTLPASASALRTAGLKLDSSEFLNSGVLTNPHLPWLGDVFALPASWPLANVFSVGDVLVLCGVAWGAHRICGSRRQRLTGRRRGRRTGTLSHTACWNAKVAQPANAIPDRLSSSCNPLPVTSSQAPKAKPRATFPEAGTVVTEMKTPESPPTFADVRDSTPAAAAMSATMKDHLSGE